MNQILDDVLYHLRNQIQDFLFFDMVDLFIEKKEIWFNYRGETFIVSLRKIDKQNPSLLAR